MTTDYSTMPTDEIRAHKQFQPPLSANEALILHLCDRLDAAEKEVTYADNQAVVLVERMRAAERTAHDLRADLARVEGERDAAKAENTRLIDFDSQAEAFEARRELSRLREGIKALADEWENESCETYFPEHSGALRELLDGGASE